MSRCRLILIGVVLWPGVLMAHVPVFPEGAGTEPQNALQITDPDLSQVVYAELMPTSPQLWLKLTVGEGQALKMRLGVPQIDRLAEFRPALVVLGPGLPEIALPFDAPAGLGGSLFATDDVASPEAFYEPFTGTESWILRDESVLLPSAGEYYVVAFSPAGQLGKLWVAIGEREQFSGQDLAELPQDIQRVRAFHEVAPGPGIPCFFVPAAAGLAIVLLRSGRHQT